MFDTFTQKDLISFCHLLPGHAIFGITGIIHNIVGNSKMPARIIAAADRIRYISHFFQKINMGDIIQIDSYIQLPGQLKILCRRSIGGKHNFVAFEADRIRHQQLRIRRTICTAAFLMQYFQYCRVRSSLDGKIFFEPLIPGKGFIYSACRFANSRFII